MPRTHIKKKAGPAYGPEDLQKAIAQVSGGRSIGSVAKDYKIPKETLRRWVVSPPNKIIS